MKITTYTILGKEAAAWDFSEKVLGKRSPALLAQAIRVYESNAHQGTSSVKTRGEVNGSTRKIYRQKGTGNARHGAKYAPVFVGGGIAHGPKAIRPENLKLSKAMRRRALATALLTRLDDKAVLGVEGIKKATGKTSSAAKLFASIANHPKNKVLVVTRDAAPKLFLMVRGLQGITMKRASQVNAYDLIAHDSVVVTKSALDNLVVRTQKPVGATV